MDDRRAALLLACLALAGAGVRHFLSQLARPLLPGERIDLDHADVSDITRLPRVGPALAQRIVAWRTEHGPFGTLSRLDSVPGVGVKLLDAIRPFVVQP